MRLSNCLDQIKGKKILVVGDVMLDVYLHGKAHRISPEAPVPVVAVEKEVMVPGGAGNVAVNVGALGCQTFIAGYVGQDKEGDCLKRYFESENIDTSYLITHELLTTCKTRILADHQHVVRCDRDSIVSSKVLSENLRNDDFDVIVISDYNKGTINSSVMSVLSHFSCPIICDGKPINKNLFHGLFCIAPNLSEAKQMANLDDDASNHDIAQHLISEMSLQCIILTMADEGILFLDNTGEKLSLPAYIDGKHNARERLDVTGAGDTIISTFAAAIAAGVPGHQAVFISNVAAGMVVRKIGTSFCSIKELREEISNVAEFERDLLNEVIVPARGCPN